MDNYENLYYLLFNRITDIIEELKSIQQLSEEMFITVPEKQPETDDTMQQTLKKQTAAAVCFYFYKHNTSPALFRKPYGQYCVQRERCYKTI